MVESEVKKHSKLLSRVIVESEEFQNLIKAQEAVNSDLNAYQIMMDYQKLGMEANNNRMKGIALSPKEIKALTEQETKVQNNSVLKHWDYCQTTFNNMMEDVLKTIREGLSGKPVRESKKKASSNSSERLNIYSQ